MPSCYYFFLQFVSIEHSNHPLWPRVQEQPSNLPAYSLDFEYRKRLIMRELEAYNADILCLQEVQSDHWANFWKEALDALGYDG